MPWDGTCHGMEDTWNRRCLNMYLIRACTEWKMQEMKHAHNGTRMDWNMHRNEIYIEENMHGIEHYELEHILEWNMHGVERVL